jgi:hypothetical protein
MDLRRRTFEGFEDPAVEGATFFCFAASLAFSFTFLSFSAFAAALFFDSDGAITTSESVERQSMHRLWDSPSGETQACLSRIQRPHVLPASPLQV